VAGELSSRTRRGGGAGGGCGRRSAVLRAVERGGSALWHGRFPAGGGCRDEGPAAPAGKASERGELWLGYRAALRLGRGAPALQTPPLLVAGGLLARRAVLRAACHLAVPQTAEGAARFKTHLLWLSCYFSSWCHVCFPHECGNLLLLLPDQKQSVQRALDSVFKRVVYLQKAKSRSSLSRCSQSILEQH